MIDIPYIVMGFKLHDDLKMKVGPAFVELNPLFAAASEALIRPYRLAIELERVPEEKQLELLARTYSESVIIETDPAMERKDVYKWLLANPVEFTYIRDYAQHKANFVEDGDGDQIQSAG